MKFVDKYITKEDGVYRINACFKDYKDIVNKVLLLKNSFNRDFTLDDFVLVRIVKEKFIPINMEYCPLNHTNAYHLIQNPYGFILECIRFYNPSTFLKGKYFS